MYIKKHYCRLNQRWTEVGQYDTGKRKAVHTRVLYNMYVPVILTLFSKIPEGS